MSAGLMTCGRRSSPPLRLTRSRGSPVIRRIATCRLCADCSIADKHRLATDPNLLENSSTDGERNVNTTRATHPDALEAHEPRGRVS